MPDRNEIEAPVAARGRERGVNPQLVSPQLAAALAHPTRAHALTVLSQRPASPRELAEELDLSTKHLAYHVRRLVELGCVELAETKPASGGRVVEHVYRATQRSYFDADGWDSLDDREKHGVTTTIMRLASGDLNEAIVSGTIDDPDDNHISRTVMAVDREGWAELVDLLGRTVEEVLGIQERVAVRGAGAGAEAEKLLAKVLIFHFRAPEPGGAAGGAA